MRSESLERSSTASQAAKDLEQEVARIASLNKDDLRALWRQTRGQEPPEALSKDLMARALTQALQQSRLGGLTSKLRKQLAAFADGRGESARYVKTGSIMVREYQGQLHEVVVVPEGFLWAGQTYRSLSTIARKITGTTWNGPRFFGLRGASQPVSKDAEELPDTQKASPSSQTRKIVRRRPGRVLQEGQRSKGPGREESHGEVGI
jgi:hypothetical protein